MRPLAAAVLGSLLLAAAVRLPRLGRPSLAPVEQAAFVESQGFSTAAPIPQDRPLAADELPRRPGPKPLDATALALWTRFGGMSEGALRLASALAGVLTAALVALAAARLAGPRAAAWAGVLLALSPIHVLASRQAGPDTSLLLVLMAALLLLLRIDVSGSGREAVALGLALAVLAASGTPALAALAPLLLAWLTWRADRRRAASLACATALFAVAGAALAGLARSPLDYGKLSSWVPETTASGVLRCAGASFTRLVGIEYHLVVSRALVVLPLTALFAAVAAWGASGLKRRDRALAVAGASAPFVLGVVLAPATGRVTPLQAHRLLAALPFLVLLMAAGLARARPSKAGLAGSAMAAIVAAFLAVALRHRASEASPTRAVAAQVTRCRVLVVTGRPLDLLTLAAWGVPGPFYLRSTGESFPARPAVVVGTSSACAAGGAACADLPVCPAGSVELEHGRRLLGSHAARHDVGLQVVLPAHR